MTFDDGTVVRSAPLKIDIAPPKLAVKAADPHRPGPEKMEAAGTEGNLKEAKRVKLNGKLGNLTGVQHLGMAGQFTVARDGLFELVITGSGEISLAVDDRPLLSGQGLDRKQTRFSTLALERGPHDLKIEFSPADKTPYLKLVLEGDQVATVPELRVVSDDRMRANATP